MPVSLKPGDKAPSFSGRDQNGKTISLNQLKGKKVILYFYPEDDTPACTAQACNLRDNYSELLNKGFEVIGISPNDLASHAKFAVKFSLPFPLLPDPDHKIIDKYGVWGEKNLYGRKYMGLLRTSFVINEKGIIERIILRPKTKTHSEEIIAGPKKK
jgi:thioredoxin-dependent peroxiredoxin